MEKFFKIKERGSTVKTEVIAGVTTFMAMAYVLMTTASTFEVFGEGYYNAIYISTAICAVMGSAIIGLLANLPLAQATGIGLSAFFVYTVCLGMGFTYANALVLVLFEGILFILLTVTGLRKFIFDAIPSAVKTAIPAGIGLFIAFLGFQNSGLVVGNEATKVTLFSFSIMDGTPWADIMPKIAFLVTLVLIAVFTIKKVKGSVLWGMLTGTALYYILGLTVDGFYDNFFEGKTLNPFEAFGDFFNLSLGKVFTEGFNFDGYLQNHSVSELIVVIAATALAFGLVDMFDTVGTLYGACARGDMLDKDGNIPNMNRAMLSDAIATTAGSVFGSSTVTTFVEASAGIVAGGRTGLAALVTAGLFFVSMFLCPIAALIPSAATAAALVYVGVLMIAGIKEIDWKDIEVAVPAFLTLVMMPFTYNISTGIAFGIISYILIKVCSGKIKEINIGTWVIGILFIAMFALKK